MKKSLQVKQRDRSDCGAACLASVTMYYGLRLSVSRIRQYAGTSQRGTSIHGLLEAAERLNFQARGARVKETPLSSIPLPAIFHLVLENDMQHFVVVYKIKKSRIVLMDPGLGKIISQSSEAFKKSWSGVIILLIPSEQFRQGDERKTIVNRFWQLVQPHRSILLQALLGAMLYSLLGLSTSVYVQKIIDFVLPDANTQLLNILSIGMIILLSFKIFTGYFKSLIVLRTGQQIDSRLILGYYKHLLDLPQRFFDHMRVGEIISRVNDALRIRIFINDVALNLVVCALTVMLSICAMFIYSWKMALLMLFTIPVYLLIYWFSNRVNSKWQRKMMERSAALESQLVESIQGISTIRRFESSAFFMLKTEKRFVPLMQAMYNSGRTGLILSNVSEWVTSLLTIIILWWGTYLVIDQKLSAGELLSFYTLTGFFAAPVQALIGSNKPMQDALIAADRLFEIIDLETEKEAGPGLEIERFRAAGLVFNDVYFSYGPGRAVFTGLNIHILQNQITGVIGESGCGKSTLLALVQKFYSPDHGTILLGDVDIQYLSNHIVRQEIVAVPQHTDLFQGNIISNIALGEEEPDLERIFVICRRLGLHDFIAGLPARYLTVIHEQGLNLSGGQQQKLGIARALYRNPAILILDEATSALDPESERKVQETLRWYHGKGTTIIVIAHRLSTIRYCDSIIFLKHGQPAICGTHESLLTENQDYLNWWKLNTI
jgi:ABC-type bacteriocin transporter